MFFFDNVVIQNGNEDSKQDGKENEPTRKESVKTTNLQSVKSAFDIFLFDDTGEIDFLVEKSQISNAFEYTYKLVDGSLPNSHGSKLITFVLVAAIILGFVVSFMETEPTFQYSPSSCDSPACNNDPSLCPNMVICEPVPNPIFERIDSVVLYLFTVEYLLKFFTCWAVNARDLDIIDNDWDGGTDDEPPVYSLFGHYFRYFMSLKNVADLVTIVPYFVMLGMHGKSRGVTLFLRVFRIGRVVRIYKGTNRIEQARKMLVLVVRTLLKSIDPIFVMLLFLCLAMIFYGSIIYAVEGGIFQVTADHPQGQYLRKSVNQYGIEISPFNSIPTAMYFVVVTCTTVGYGDLVPTSWVGRAISSVMSLTAVVLLALPIGIIGSNFAALYRDYEFEKEHVLHHKFEDMTEKDMLLLFEDIDEDDNKTIDIFELKTAFDQMGLQVDASKLMKFFADADHDKSGAISSDEFILLCKRIQERQAVVHKHKGHQSQQLKTLDVSFLNLWKRTKSYYFGTASGKHTINGSSETASKSVEVLSSIDKVNARDVQNTTADDDSKQMDTLLPLGSARIAPQRSLSQQDVIDLNRVAANGHRHHDHGRTRALENGSASSTTASQVTAETSLGSLISVDHFLKVLSFQALEGSAEDNTAGSGISPAASAFDGDVKITHSTNLKYLDQPKSEKLYHRESTKSVKKSQSKSATALLKRAADLRKQKEEAIRLCRQLDSKVLDIFKELQNLNTA